MNKELIISSSAKEVSIALLEDKQLVELHKEQKGNHYSVGDVYLGRVRKMMPGLNAAFVSLGDDKDGFAHFLDFGPRFNSYSRYLRLAMNGDASAETLKDFKAEARVPKEGNVSDILKQGQFVLVQITKEPISTKGPKLSGDVSLAGRYLVLNPFESSISISHKIKNAEERARLRKLIQCIKPENFGVIVRTVAEGHSVAELDTDMHLLLDKWARMTRQLKTANSEQQLVSELSGVPAMVRDELNDDFDAIYVDDETMYGDIRSYLQTISPERVDSVRHYKLKTPIFEQFGVQRDIRRAFGRIVTIRSGVYLYIEHTEAMHVIDVNSGNHIKAGNGQEDTALQVNKESAHEIARQLRLRDMGGIVIVDFIDMAKSEHRKELYDYMTEEMRRDKSRHTILPLSTFGLMQITRQRVRPVVEVDVQEQCPLCGGSGTVKSTLTVVDDIGADLRHLVSAHTHRRLTVEAHPFVASYLRQGLWSQRMRWMRELRIRLGIRASESMSLLDYRFFDADGNEIVKQ